MVHHGREVGTSEFEAAGRIASIARRKEQVTQAERARLFPSLSQLGPAHVN